MELFFRSQGFIHFFFALLLFPLQQYIPEVVKLGLAPYMFYLVWSLNPIYLPTLIVWITPGTTIAYSVLISCLFITIWNLKVLLRLRLAFLLFLTFLPFPIFLWMTFIRVFENGEGIVQTLIPLGYYLGLFPFYYGVMASKKFDAACLQGVFFVLFLLPLLKFLPVGESSIRLYWLSYPVFFTILFYSVYKFRSLQGLGFGLSLLSLFFLLLNPFPKFTVLFSGVFGFLLIYLRLKDLTFFLSFFALKRAIPFFVLIVVLILYSNESATENMQRNRIEFDERSYYESWDVFQEKLYYKTFGDRAVIWAGGWKAIMENSQYYFFPPYQRYSYSWFNSKGHYISDSEVSIHNLGLELMRNYGVFIGLIVFLLFFLFMVLGAGRFFVINNDVKLALLTAGTIGSAFVGALVGQFPLMITFSMSMISLFGMFFGLYRSRINGS